jgi:hypothetical protein
MDCDVTSFIVCDCSPLGAKQVQLPATDQEKEKLNPYKNSEHRSVNALTDINFHAAKVS